MSVSNPTVARAAGPVLVGCLVLIAGLGLSGCTSVTDRPTLTASTTRAAGAPLPAIAHLSAITCTADADDAWSFTATVTNRDRVTEDYTIKASLVRKADGYVAGSKAMTTELATGKSITVTAARFFTGDPHGLVCVPSVVKKPA